MVLELNELTGNDKFKHEFFTNKSLMKDSGFKLFIKKLSQPNFFASLTQITTEYIVIAFLVYANIVWSSLLLYVVSVILIGARMHGLLILMHDAAHYKFSKSKTLNELVCKIFIAFPFFINFYHWRAVHFAHHRDTGGDEDPDWVAILNHPDYTLPMKAKQFAYMLIQHMFGIKFLLVLTSTKHTFLYKLLYLPNFLFDVGRIGSKRIDGKPSVYYTNIQRIIIWGCYAALFFVLLKYSLFKYFLLFWVAPLFLWTHFITKLRSYTEHCGMKHQEAYTNSRTLYVSWFDIVCLGYSWNVGYHLDHHLFPSIPSYRLKELHNVIKTMSPYKENAHITTNGVLGALKECTN